jgi:hypothetical protein
LQECLAMARAMRRVTVWHLQSTIECAGMRARQHGEGGEAIRMPVREAPSDAAAPVVSDEMESGSMVAENSGEVNGVLDQPIEMIAHDGSGVGPRAGRLTTLVRRDGVIPGLRQRHNLRLPRMHRFRKAVQHPSGASTGPPARASNRKPGAVSILRSSTMSESLFEEIVSLDRS